MSHTPRENQYTWQTGRDVNTNDLAMTHENDQADPLIEDDAQQDDPTPNKSAGKDVWVDYRKEQGYTDEQLETVPNMDALRALPDNPEDYEAPSE